VLYETADALPSQYDWDFGESSATNGTYGWVQRSLFGGALGVHTINIYRADTSALVLTQASTGTTNGNFQVWNGSQTGNMSTSASYAGGATVKMAGAAAANDAALVSNGGSPATDATVTMNTVTELRIGDNGVGPLVNGHIKQIMHLPRRMSNADMQTLTS
jgi:hypothetical protein